MLRVVAAACCALALLLAACDPPRPERRAGGPCFPESGDRRSGIPAYPPGYSDRGFDRFFERAIAVVGDRVSHEGQGCVEGDRLVAVLGVKDLTQTDRRRIEALAPPWVKPELFGTEYSMSELQEFADRARHALEGAGVRTAGTSFYEIRGVIVIGVVGASIGLDRFVGAEIPPDSFVVETGGLGQAL